MIIRATQIESWRLFNTYDWMTEDELQQTLRGKFIANERMRVGTALHALLETDSGLEHIVDDITYIFDDSVDIAWQCIPAGASFEVEAGREIDGITVVGHCDVIVGNQVWDHKVSTKAPDPDKYIPSMQWRTYLWLFDAEHFVYNLLQVKKKAGVWSIIGNLRFSQYRYPGMMADLRIQINGLAEYIARHNLQAA